MPAEGIVEDEHDPEKHDPDGHGGHYGGGLDWVRQKVELRVDRVGEHHETEQPEEQVPK